VHDEFHIGRSIICWRDSKLRVRERLKLPERTPKQGPSAVEKGEGRACGNYRREDRFQRISRNRNVTGCQSFLPNVTSLEESKQGGTMGLRSPTLRSDCECCTWKLWGGRTITGGCCQPASAPLSLKERSIGECPEPALRLDLAETWLDDPRKGEAGVESLNVSAE